MCLACRTVDIKHHLPVGRLYALVEAEPDLSATPQSISTALRRSKNRSDQVSANLKLYQENRIYLQPNSITLNYIEKSEMDDRLELILNEPTFVVTHSILSMHPSSY